MWPHWLLTQNTSHNQTEGSRNRRKKNQLPLAPLASSWFSSTKYITKKGKKQKRPILFLCSFEEEEEEEEEEEKKKNHRKKRIKHALIVQDLYCHPSRRRLCLSN